MLLEMGNPIAVVESMAPTGAPVIAPGQVGKPGTHSCHRNSSAPLPAIRGDGSALKWTELVATPLIRTRAHRSLAGRKSALCTDKCQTESRFKTGKSLVVRAGNFVCRRRTSVGCYTIQMGTVARCSSMFASWLNGDSLRILFIDLPVAFVLAAPYLFIISGLKSRNASLVVPGVVLFVLGFSSLYVALVESPFTPETFVKVQMGVDLSQHRHDLALLTFSTLAAAALLFVLGVIFRSAVISLKKTQLCLTPLIFGAAYIVCFVWLLFASHQGARLAKHLSEHSQP